MIKSKNSTSQHCFVCGLASQTLIACHSWEIPWVELIYTTANFVFY